MSARWKVVIGAGVLGAALAIGAVAQGQTTAAPGPWVLWEHRQVTDADSFRSLELPPVPREVYPSEAVCQKHRPSLDRTTGYRTWTIHTYRCWPVGVNPS